MNSYTLFSNQSAFSIDYSRQMHRSSLAKSNGTNVRGGSNRAKSVDSARARRREKNAMSKIYTEPKSLDDAGCYFNDSGKLVSIDNQQPFQYYVYPNNEDNNRRYHAIGRLVDQYVYERMERDLGLRRIQIPQSAKPNEPTGFFFASDNLISAEYLMIIIHGMGVVRAGQWSRKLIINENLDVGSQLSYIQRALAQGYAVIVTNTNLNTDESSRSILSSPRPIRASIPEESVDEVVHISDVLGSASAEEHACYVWENYVRKSPAQHICIMAHSYGGAVVLELAGRYTSEFDKRVFAVALTDSPMKSYTRSLSGNVLKMLHKRTINWVADGTKKVDTPIFVREYGQIRAAGHVLHEWTSYTAMNSIFKFFDEERKKIERSKR